MISSMYKPMYSIQNMAMRASPPILKFCTNVNFQQSAKLKHHQYFFLYSIIGSESFLVNSVEVYRLRAYSFRFYIHI